MSYLNAEDVLPKELIEEIQKYVSGKAIYIPSIAKQPWGSKTDTKDFFRKRNMIIYTKYQEGISISEIADKYSLSKKSIQRIVRTIKNAQAKER